MDVVEILKLNIIQAMYVMLLDNDVIRRIALLKVGKFFWKILCYVVKVPKLLDIYLCLHVVSS